MSSDSKCSICLEDFKYDENISEIVRCKHPFHSHCISLWRREKNECPVCRGHIENLLVKKYLPPRSLTSRNNETRLARNQNNSRSLSSDGEIRENQNMCVGRHRRDLRGPERTRNYGPNFSYSYFDMEDPEEPEDPEYLLSEELWIDYQLNQIHADEELGLIHHFDCMRVDDDLKMNRHFDYTRADEVSGLNHHFDYMCADDVLRIDQFSYLHYH